jgi:hypothetical protein
MATTIEQNVVRFDIPVFVSTLSRTEEGKLPGMPYRWMKPNL